MNPSVSRQLSGSRCIDAIRDDQCGRGVQPPRLTAAGELTRSSKPVGTGRGDFGPGDKMQRRAARSSAYLQLGAVVLRNQIPASDHAKIVLWSRDGAADS